MTTPPSGGRDAEALLDQLWRTALDDDYYAVRDRSPRRYSRVLSGVTLLAFGLLISTAAVQTATDQPATDLERAALIDDIEAREELVHRQRGRVEELTAEVEALREAAAGTDVDERAAAVVAADEPAVGPGIVITARSGDRGASAQISDLDLQLLVNGLWYAGAEAVAINGQRIGSMTAIRWAGESVTVNYRTLNEPYKITAIGPPELEESWTANPSGRHWQHRSDASGVSWDIVTDDELTVPAVPRARLSLTHATSMEEVP
ncbi:DUF881 domain-containing protein [Aeromicrobium phragmitis]|uniref:DUF881 domain-containing protein n=1 Tax=Aeromicrobium phragmitis TaxID=2478914 RepID=A0A3L8PJM3_9ACTN|nr:DUF881 domain-containing protein [Aeromicrobium phragmitis]RLV55545.1 DUF881 domain-containing protein [Aeromicrobium phragmitis]